MTLSVLGLALTAAQATDWPTYRADAARSGCSPDPLPDQLELLWERRGRTPPRPAWPSSSRMAFDFAFQPILVGETVVFGSSVDDSVVAIDAASGRERWRFYCGGPVRFAPAAWRDRIFVASDDGRLVALALEDAAVLWEHRGGPNERKCLGNGRMISRWPVRGGPVVLDDTVYYAAGIWPSDGVYLHALDAQTGKVRWTNDRSGGLTMAQPHPGAMANSGVAPQGYLVATGERLFVPTGRAVPAAFRRSDGELEYYRLQQNGSIGGSRAIVADRFVLNGGCFLERETGDLAARAGRGVLSAAPNGILQLTGKTLRAYRWAVVQRPNRRGEVSTFRGLKQYCDVTLADPSVERRRAERVIQAVPALKNLYEAKVRFKQAFPEVAKETGLERTLSQARPDVRSLGYDVAPFLAAAYERRDEVIAAGDEAVCGGTAVVRVVDLANQKVRWSHPVEGSAVGLAAANGRLVVATTSGRVYCFGAPRGGSTGAADDESRSEPPPDATSASAVDFAAAAEEILRKAAVTEGFCLDLGCGDGQLALELVKRSKLRVIGIDSDATAVARARRTLDAAGVYGNRIVIHQGDPQAPPYPRRFADLIVSSRRMSDPSARLSEAEIRRMQRPYGGVACLGSAGALSVDRRGPLPGAGQWTHQNMNAANLLCSSDDLVRGPLEMAWYRDAVLELPDRHAQGPAPLVSQGRLVVEGVDGLCALDAYNGRTLWTNSIPGILADWDGVHHDVGVGDTGSNFCLSDEAVFVRTGNQCLKIELATGEKLRQFETPIARSARNRAWGYVAYHGGLLFGSVLNDEHTVSPRYKNIRLRTESVLFFVLDAETGQLQWKYEPQHSIRNNAIAIADGRVYLIDRPLAMEDRVANPDPINGRSGPLLAPGQQPGGVLIAFDARNGSVLWRASDDIFGTQLAVSEKHGVLLMYYQAVKHKFFKLPSEVGGRTAALDTDSGARLWDKSINYVTRPMINDDVIYAEGGAWRLRSGDEVPWKFKRSYGCGQIAGSTHLMVFRSATLGYLDLTRSAGTENFGGIRPSCWFSAVPAGGLVLVADGSSKCACSYQMEAWLALQPRR